MYVANPGLPRSWRQSAESEPIAFGSHPNHGLITATCVVDPALYVSVAWVTLDTLNVTLPVRLCKSKVTVHLPVFADPVEHVPAPPLLQVPVTVAPFTG